MGYTNGYNANAKLMLIWNFFIDFERFKISHISGACDILNKCINLHCSDTIFFPVRSDTDARCCGRIFAIIFSHAEASWVMTSWGMYVHIWASHFEQQKKCDQTSVALFVVWNFIFFKQFWNHRRGVGLFNQPKCDPQKKKKLHKVQETHLRTL